MKSNIDKLLASTNVDDVALGIHLYSEYQPIEVLINNKDYIFNNSCFFIELEKGLCRVFLDGSLSYTSLVREAMINMEFKEIIL